MSVFSMCYAVIHLIPDSFTADLMIGITAVTHHKSPISHEINEIPGYPVA